MEHKTNIKVTTKVITPEMAAYYLGRNVRNRDVSKSHVANLAAQMAKGQWELNGSTIVFDKNGILLDGQHRLRACVVCGKPFKTFVIEGIENTALMTIDTGKSRSGGDIFKFMDVPNDRSVEAVVAGYMTFVKGSNALVKRTRYTVGLNNPDIYAEYKNREDQFQRIARYSQALYHSFRGLFTKKRIWRGDSVFMA